MASSEGAIGSLCWTTEPVDFVLDDGVDDETLDIRFAMIDLFATELLLYLVNMT